jgi:hypothetical protein
MLRQFSSKIPAALALLAVVLSQPTNCAAGLPAVPQRSIVLSPKDDVLSFGRTTSLHLTYRNESQTAWSIVTPESSAAISVRYRLNGKTDQPQGYSFGRMNCVPMTIPNGNQVYAMTLPLKKMTSVPALGSREFSIDFEQEWTGNVVPGIWSVWIEDGELELQSNRLLIPVRFTMESIRLCTDIAADPRQDAYKRKWHAEWLQKIMPTLTFSWWYAETPAAEREQLEKNIQSQLKGFRGFSEDQKNRPAIEAAIARINQEAGVEPASRPPSTATPQTQPSKPAVP